MVYFDIYIVAGGGMANNDTVQVHSPAVGIDATDSIVRSGLDPMFDLGIGIKLFLNDAMGLVFDMRDYVVYSNIYDQKALKSNFSVFLGITFFLPTFG